MYLQVLSPMKRRQAVYRVVPRDATELEAINTLYRQSTNLELDFWKSPTAIGASADVMVPPDAIEFVIDYFKSNNLDYWTTIENAAIHTAAYFIDQLISGYNVDPQITAYVNTLNFYILPVANPDDKFFVEDAYTFLASERIVELKSVEKITGDAIDVVRGVDLNRNFDFHWSVTFALTFTLDPVSSFQFVDEKKAILAEAFSEPEARAIRDKMLSSELRVKSNLSVYILNNHLRCGFIRTITNENHFPKMFKILSMLERTVLQRLKKFMERSLSSGTGADILYPSAGGSDDWAKAKAGVKYVYLLELRPGEEEWDGFLLSQHQLIPTARETWEGVKVVLNAVLNRSRQTQQSRIVSTFAPTTLSTSLSTSMVTTARPVGQRVDQQSLRTNFHDRLQRLRQSQMEARVRQQQFRAQPGQSVLQFGGIFPSQQSTTQRTLLPPNVQSFNQQPQSCTDRSRWCTAWLRSNPRLCVESSIFMRTDCRRSCFFCS
ncbi:ShKT domain-containing protein [Aphelenchoides besseyi]|nr:ShKT domain-containing protein [Aphelenchoides besseyi]